MASRASTTTTTYHPTNSYGKGQPNNTSPTSQALAMEAAIRHKHDMADAKAMMEARSHTHPNRTTTTTNTTTTTGNRTVSLFHVEAAIEALEKAEQIDRDCSRSIERFGNSVETQKRQQEALELYQEGIHIVLLFLKQDPSTDASHRSTLQKHIQRALSNAEILKMNLNATKTNTGRARPRPKNESQTKPSFLDSLFSLGSKSTDAEEDKRTIRTSTKSSTPSKSSQSQSMTRRPVRRGSATNREPTPSQPSNGTKKTVRRKSPKPPSQSASQPSTQRAEPSTRTSPSSMKSTSPANQELQHQILDEFYIPSSTLQKTTWDDVAGLKPVKQALQESVILPLQRPDLFQGLRRPQNLLLYGPPGTGKTLLVRATASTSQALLFQCSAASLTSKWMGDAEKIVRALFQVASAAAHQHHSPALLFLDEVDSVLSSRRENEHEASRRLKTEFMIQMEGLAKRSDEDNDSNVLVLACTNCPWDLDPAVLRRFPRRLYVPLPDQEARQAMLQHLLETQLKHDHALSPRDVKDVARALEGYSGSDIYAIASQAAFGPIREVSAQKLSTVQTLRPVSRRDWMSAIEAAPPPSVTPQLLQQYHDWQNKHHSNK